MLRVGLALPILWIEHEIGPSAKKSQLNLTLKSNVQVRSRSVLEVDILSSTSTILNAKDPNDVIYELRHSDEP